MNPVDICHHHSYNIYWKVHSSEINKSHAGSINFQIVYDTIFCERIISIWYALPNPNCKKYEIANIHSLRSFSSFFIVKYWLISSTSSSVDDYFTSLLDFEWKLSLNMRMRQTNITISKKACWIWFHLLALPNYQRQSSTIFKRNIIIIYIFLSHMSLIFHSSSNCSL